ncbi:MAG: hypothetical protein HYW50_00705 [Candidatus Diapherotrites archaeon]|nr:hypothetical protein [Candidatus Diapherotrites archaeon]
MSKNKSSEEKDFLISKRKSIGAGLTNAPVWAMQKAAKRIWNKRAKRHWRQTDFGNLFKKKQSEQGKVYNKKRVKSGWKKRKE